MKDRDEVVGNQTKIKVVKNKLAPPFRIVELDIMYGEGVSKTGELLDLGMQAGVVEKSGAWFSAGDDRLGQGRENAKQFLRDNPDIAGRIENAIRANAGLVSDAMLEGPGDQDGKIDEGQTKHQNKTHSARACSVPLLSFVVDLRLGHEQC